MTTGPSYIHIAQIGDKLLEVKFPYNKALVAAIKELPGAKWDAQRKAWIINAKWRKRLDALRAGADEIVAQGKAEHEAAVAQARGVFDRAKAEGRTVSTDHIKISIDFEMMEVEFATYQEDAVQAMKSLGGKWNEKTRRWMVPLLKAEALEALMPELEQKVALATDRLRKMRQELEQERQREREERQKERDEWAVGSIVWLQQTAPQIGVPFRYRGEVKVATKSTRPFKVDLDAFHVEGGMPSLEEEWCVRIWLRDATDAEREAFERREAEAKAKREARAAAVQAEQDLARRFTTEGEYPQGLSVFPQGEMLCEIDRHLKIYGGGREWRLADGYVWYMEGHGADGDDWSANNLTSTRAWRMPADPETVQKLKEIGETLK